MMKPSTLTQTELKNILRYDSKTGLFYWAAARKSIRVGDIAGDFSGRYVRIKISQRQYPAHCLAWLYMTGAWPNSGLDHRDTDYQNNKWENLRKATPVQNCANRKPLQNKKYTPLKGVTFQKQGNRKKRWMATIRIAGRKKFIGYYSTPEQAHAAHMTIAKKLHGEFARAA